MTIKNKIYFSAKELSNVYSLVAVGMLLSLRVVLGIFANYSMAMFGNLIKIHVNFIPIIVAAVLFGPICAGIVGAAGDFLSFFLNSAGQTYFPGMTLNGFLTGLIFGLFLYKNINKITNIILAWVINVIFVEVLLMALWLNIMNGATYTFYLGVRFTSEVLIKSIPTILLMVSFCKIATKIKIPDNKKRKL